MSPDALASRLQQALAQGMGSAWQGRPYQPDTAFIPWSHLPVLLEDYARLRGLAPEAWLQGAGVRRGELLSPRQLLGLLSPLQALARDSAFVLGQLCLPGHYGLASQALQSAPNLYTALQVLARFSARLSPLLTPRLLVHGEDLLLYWTPACGLPPAQRNFLVDMQMCAVSSLASSAVGQPLPWRHGFNRTRPADLSQHAAYLGTRLQFGCHLDMMRLPLVHALQPWPAGRGPSGVDLQALASQGDPQAEQRGLCAALYDRLLACAPRQPTLDEMAAGFACSPATFKRHLAQQGTSFQAELDGVRAHLALYLLMMEGLGAEALAQTLGFYDGTNFRRAFRRWTGLAPRALLAQR